LNLRKRRRNLRKLNRKFLLLLKTKKFLLFKHIRMLYFKDLVTPIDGFYKGQIGIVVMENTDPNANGPKKYQVSFGGQ
jgi:hypothetical protein